MHSGEAYFCDTLISPLNRIGDRCSAGGNTEDTPPGGNNLTATFPRSSMKSNHAGHTIRFTKSSNLLAFIKVPRITARSHNNADGRPLIPANHLLIKSPVHDRFTDIHKICL